MSQIILRLPGHDSNYAKPYPPIIVIVRTDIASLAILRSATAQSLADYIMNMACSRVLLQVFDSGQNSPRIASNRSALVSHQSGVDVP
jgi:hypothetical protein